MSTAQIHHRVDLTNSNFPLLSTQLGRSVLVSSFDKSPTGERVNTPQIYYCHNVMPTLEGVVSVGYNEVVPTITAEPTTAFQDVRIIFSETGTRCHLGIAGTGLAYILEPGDVVWRHITSHPALGTKLTTIGTVKGTTYIHLHTVGTFTYNSVTHTFTSVTLGGMPISDIIGVAASSGYLVAYNELEIAWSSTISPIDFIPSTVTGAGYGSVADLEGLMVFIVPNSLGLLIYTSANVVAATYTGNKQYPFKFRAVDNSKGALGLDQVAYEVNSAEHFAYTKGGLQSVNSRKASNLLPEVTDFLAGKVLEDFDELTYTFSSTPLTVTMKKKVKLIASRYLVISYGITEFTHAIIYDIALKKLGKIKFTHVDVFEYIGAQVELSKETLAFVDKIGKISTLEFSVPSTGRVGVVVLGKYQYKRGRHLVMHAVQVERVEVTDTFDVRLLASLDGTNISSVVSGYEESVANMRHVHFRESARNHSIALVGQFNLTSLQLEFTIGGER